MHTCESACLSSCWSTCARVQDAAGQATWIITFQNTDEGQELEYIATHKTNWGEYFLLYLADANEYVTGKGVPEDTSGYEDMYMKDIRIDRVRHGRGFLRFSDERGFYSGDWRRGIMHGQGTQINALGRYQGGFEEGLCSGNATMVFSRGDTYTGEYRAPSFHSHTSLLGGAEYLEGLPHGTGAMRFTDGSCYDGGFELGSPAGIGKYTCVTGAGKEGEFSAWSGLHGEGSETMDDVTRIGNFRTGGMHRFGTEIDMKVGTYDGDFECGMRHGFGVSESRVVRGTYVGSYFLGQRTGRGILDLSTPPTDDAEQEQAKKTIAAKLREAAEAVNRTRRVVIPSDGEYRFEGRWLNNRPRQRGVFTMRNGSVSPLKFSFLWTIDGYNHHLPLLVDMAAAEERLDTERGALIRVLTKSVLDQRKAKESGNLAKYNVFMSLAHTRMLDVIMRNRALQAGVRGVVFRLKEKQESAARAAQALAAALKEDSSSSSSGGGASAPNASGEGGAGMNVGSS
ncbi:hypothetical protein EON66_03780 [archaeon]|nr:MAG: hypothetical protein EON66_03780 [archaeon]